MLKLLTAFLVSSGFVMAAPPWSRHVIDNGSRGADGVRLGDADRDGRTDIVTGWEEGGAIRICFGPPITDVRKPWPVAEIARVRSPEDAVFFDVNRDGWLDVVSSCEGSTQCVFLHLNPGRSTAATRDGRRWKTIPVTTTQHVSRWMFCEPLTNGRVVLGSKNPNGQIAIADLAAAGEARPQVIRSAGWIMSLVAVDLDRDGDEDIVYSDRKGPQRGIGWLQQNGDRWTDHSIGATEHEVMFLKVLRRKGRPIVYCDTKASAVAKLQPADDLHAPWKLTLIPHPEHVGGGKSVAVGDLNGDGHDDLVCACEHADQRSGVYWMPESADAQRPTRWYDISGTTQGIKFDRLELLDLDDDGDLDVLTCEERDQLGVIWYENPHCSSVP